MTMDTRAHRSEFGEVVILTLIQIGGLEFPVMFEVLGVGGVPVPCERPPGIPQWSPGHRTTRRTARSRRPSTVARRCCDVTLRTRFRLGRIGAEEGLEAAQNARSATVTRWLASSAARSLWAGSGAAGAKSTRSAGTSGPAR
ncbi:hypothetical protein GCM10009678_15030 [Actinomadura kijaniata]